jgi:hypothetical protein
MRPRVSLLLLISILLAFTSAAHATWPPNGAPVSTGSGNQFLMSIVSDDAAGAIIVWEDTRSGGTDLYAQRVDASGAPLWAANGIPLCTAVGGQFTVAMIPDGSGGAIVAWLDYRSGLQDIYAQRVNAAGVTQWAANGVPVCTATGAQALSSSRSWFRTV